MNTYDWYNRLAYAAFTQVGGNISGVYWSSSENSSNKVGSVTTISLQVQWSYDGKNYLISVHPFVKY